MRPEAGLSDPVRGNGRRGHCFNPGLGSLLRAELRTAGLEPVLTTHVFSWLVAPAWMAWLGAGRDGGAELGLDRTSSRWIERVALALTAVERQLVGRVALPFGTSVLCAATMRAHTEVVTTDAASPSAPAGGA